MKNGRRIGFKDNHISTISWTNLPDMEPRTVMEHVAHMGSKIDAVNIVLEGDVTQKD